MTKRITIIDDTYLSRPPRMYDHYCPTLRAGMGGMFKVVERICLDDKWYESRPKQGIRTYSDWTPCISTLDGGD